jgi:predicted nucleic acid-binding protein
LLERGVAPARLASFLADLDTWGIRVLLTPEDIPPRIPADPDDDVVIACVVAGHATYLATYDPHFEVLGGECQGVRIVNALEFFS